MKKAPMPRFLIYYRRFKKDIFLAKALAAVNGTKDNPDFKDCPTTWAELNAAYVLMVAAAPAAVPGKQAAQQNFDALRTSFELLLRAMAIYAQFKIGDNLARIEASGLPTTKTPEKRPQEMGKVIKPFLGQGVRSGTVKARAKRIAAADGLVVYAKQTDGTFKEATRFIGFNKDDISVFAVDTSLEIKLAYWNDAGEGPLMDGVLRLYVE